MLQKIKTALDGKKTYLMTAAGSVYLCLIALGLAPNSEIVWGLIGGGTVASLRDALNHVHPASDDKN